MKIKSLLKNTFLNTKGSLLFVLFLSAPLLLFSNGPCTAVLYDFNNPPFEAGDNIVPCGPSANTTPSVAIDGAGAHNPTGTNITAMDLDCATNGGDESLLPVDVLWVTFVINIGGYFEWQTVAGADKFTWTLFYATDAVNTTFEEDNATGCDDLVEIACGDQFTGWRPEGTPDPTKRWRYYMAFYLNPADKDEVGDGVVKIRKSCGLSCVGEPTADVNIDDVCITSGSTTLTATSGLAPYTWSDEDGVIATTTDNFISVSPSTTTTYTVVVSTDALPCPGSDQATVTVGSCCDADAGTINGLSQDETICLGSTSLNSTTFSRAVPPNPPLPVGYSYAFFLVDANGNIVDPPGANSGTSTSFSFSALAAGMYNIYGVAYRDDQGGTAETYAEGFSTLSALLADIDGGTCAEVIAHNFKVTVEGSDLDCADFPGG